MANYTNVTGVYIALGSKDYPALWSISSPFGFQNLGDTSNAVFDASMYDVLNVFKTPINFLKAFSIQSVPTSNFISQLVFEKPSEEFNQNESIFNSKLLQLISIFLLTYLVTIISFGLLFPFTICYKLKWEAKHTIINRKKIVFNGKTMSLIGHYLLWWFLSIITFGIYGLWLPMKVYGWQVKNTHIKLKDEEEEKSSMVPAVIGVVLFIVIIFILGSIIQKTDWDLKIPNIFNSNREEANRCRWGGVYQSDGSCYNYKEMSESLCEIGRASCRERV